MSSDVAIRVEGLSKAYTIKHNQTDHVTLAEVALDRMKHPFRRAQSEQFWALEDVTFDVRRGEILGLIGRNGAGKSTLLKVLSRITEPTAGRIDLWGRVGSLLEVGTGFHPELTGRENIYLNGSILGMTRREIDKQFDAIIDFASVERFLDTPVKRYSSGMYVRLAFAVAAHLETEILLVDEVLAVGDQEFQRRCLEKMQQVATSGRTVVLVSHQMSNVLDACTSAVALKEGRSEYFDDPASAVHAYRATATSSQSHGSSHSKVAFTHLPRASNVTQEVQLLWGYIKGSDPLPAKVPPRVVLGVQVHQRVDELTFALTLRRDSQPVGTSFSKAVSPPSAGAAGTFELTLDGLFLGDGSYTFDVLIGRGDPATGRHTYDRIEDVLGFEVSSVDSAGVSHGDWWPGFGPLRIDPVDVAHIADTVAANAI